MQVEDSLLRIAGFPTTQFSDASNLLERICGNIQKNPDEEKFRHIKITNPKISNTMWVHPGCKEFMYYIGFKETEDKEFIRLEKTGRELKRLELAMELLQGVIAKKKILDEEAERKQKNKINSLKREKENKKKIEKMKNDPNRYQKLNLKSIDNDEEMILRIELFLTLKEIEYEDCIFESSKSIDDSNDELVNFTLTRNSKYLSGEAILERIDDEWSVKELVKLE
eukprot:gene2772-4180_t